MFEKYFTKPLLRGFVDGEKLLVNVLKKCIDIAIYVFLRDISFYSGELYNTFADIVDTMKT